MPIPMIECSKSFMGKTYRKLKLMMRLPWWLIKGNKISLTATIESGVWLNRSILGKYVYVGTNTSIDVAYIGNYSCISGVVAIGGMNHAYDKSFSINPLLNTYCKYDVPTIIGNDVWIAAHSIVLQGVKIGDGAVVGAGAVVTKDVPENTIVIGVPARFYRKRYPDDVWEMIKKSEFWNYPPPIAKQMMKDLENVIKDGSIAS